MAGISKSEKLGINFLLYVDTSDGAATPTWEAVGGQQNGTLNRSREVIETTNKLSANGFKEKEGGFAEWGIDFDGISVESNTALQKLEDAFMNNEKVKAKWETPTGNQYTGLGVLTDFPVEAPFDAEATYSGTLEGDGPYTKVPAV